MDDVKSKKKSIKAETKWKIFKKLTNLRGGKRLHRSDSPHSHWADE